MNKKVFSWIIVMVFVMVCFSVLTKANTGIRRIDGAFPDNQDNIYVDGFTIRDSNDGKKGDYHYEKIGENLYRFAGYHDADGEWHDTGSWGMYYDSAGNRVDDSGKPIAGGKPDRYASDFPSEKDKGKVKENKNEKYFNEKKKFMERSSEYLVALFNPGPGAYAVQDILFGGLWATSPAEFYQNCREKSGAAAIPCIFGDPEENWFSFLIAGYGLEHAICESRLSDYFIQDYPGHFISGNVPQKTAIINVYGKRTEYPFVDWGVSFGNIPARWFPKAADEASENPEPVGYLYKISWYVSHPYTKQEWAAGWAGGQKIDKNQFESDGNLTYHIELYGIANSNEGLPGKYKFPTMYVMPGEDDSVVVSYYDLAYMNRICIIFDGYEVEGNKKFPADCEPLENGIGGIVKETLEAPASWDFYPIPGEGASGSRNGRNIPGPGGGGFSPSSEDCPPALRGILC